MFREFISDENCELAQISKPITASHYYFNEQLKTAVHSGPPTLLSHI